MPLVSFCVPTYRRARFLSKTIQSALNQSVSDIEIVVVDDCSPDETSDVVRKFTDPRVKYSRNAANLGVPENLNAAMAKGSGEFLVLLEDHDILEPEYLAKTLGIMRRYPNVGFVATGLTTIDEEDRPLGRHGVAFPEAMPGKRLLRRMLTRVDCPFSVTTVMRRSVLQGLEPLFDTRYGWYADQHLWMRMAARTDFGYVAEPLLQFRTREEDHYLTNRTWESHLILGRIHEDNWPLLHPVDTLSSYADRLLLEKEKLRMVAMVRGGKKLRGEVWSAEDERFVNEYLPRINRQILGLVDKVPDPIARALRRVLVGSTRTRNGRNSS